MKKFFLLFKNWCHLNIHNTKIFIVALVPATFIIGNAFRDPWFFQTNWRYITIPLLSCYTVGILYFLNLNAKSQKTDVQFLEKKEELTKQLSDSKNALKIKAEKKILEKSIATNNLSSQNDKKLYKNKI